MHECMFLYCCCLGTFDIMFGLDIRNYTSLGFQWPHTNRNQNRKHERPTVNVMTWWTTGDRDQPQCKEQHGSTAAQTIGLKPFETLKPETTLWTHRNQPCAGTHAMWLIWKPSTKTMQWTDATPGALPLHWKKGKRIVNDFVIISHKTQMLCVSFRL